MLILMKLSCFTVFHYSIGLMYNCLQIILLFSFVNACNCIIDDIITFRHYFIILHFLNIIPLVSSYTKTSPWKQHYNKENIMIWMEKTIKLTEINKYISCIVYLVHIIVDILSLCNMNYMNIIYIICAFLDVIIMSILIVFSPLFILKLKIPEKYIENDVNTSLTFADDII